MERYEMAELLSQKAGVSLEEARTALEENDWDMLDAMVALERAKKTAGPAVDMETDGAESAGDAGGARVRRVKNVSGHKGERFFTNGFAVLWGYLKKLLDISVKNDFVILRRDKQLLAMPVLVLVVLMVLSFGFMLVALIAGLFCGCQYRFEGRQLGRDDINGVFSRMSSAAEDIKDHFQEQDDGQ